MKSAGDPTRKNRGRGRPATLADPAIGTKFGSLTVIRLIRKGGHRCAVTKCAYGVEHIERLTDLLRPPDQSAGGRHGPTLSSSCEKKSRYRKNVILPQVYQIEQATRVTMWNAAQKTNTAIVAGKYQLDKRVIDEAVRTVWEDIRTLKRDPRRMDWLARWGMLKEHLDETSEILTYSRTTPRQRGRSGKTWRGPISKVELARARRVVARWGHLKDVTDRKVASCVHVAFWMLQSQDIASKRLRDDFMHWEDRRNRRIRR